MDETETAMTTAKKTTATKAAPAKKAPASVEAPTRRATQQSGMDDRDALVVDYLKEHDDIGLAEMVELLKISTGAAKTTMWRLRGRPVKGELKGTPLVEAAEKAGRYKLAKPAKPRRVTKKAAPKPD